jgi:DNA-binding transcriptional ArsR family regulator
VRLNVYNGEFMASRVAQNMSPPSGDIDQMTDKAGRACALLKAMAHESRLVLLCVLSEGERSVSELEQILGERQAAVSQQLARLRLEQLVTTRREGATIYYSLASDEARAVIGALYECFCAPDKHVS